MNSEALTLLKDGVVIMLIGMGVVFAFLTIMVIVMDLNALIIKKLNKYFPEEEPKQATPSRKKQTDENEKIALAIAVAVAQSRNAA